MFTLIKLISNGVINLLEAAGFGYKCPCGSQFEDTPEGKEAYERHVQSCTRRK